jgi:hypothetical protein
MGRCVGVISSTSPASSLSDSYAERDPARRRAHRQPHKAADVFLFDVPSPLCGDLTCRSNAAEIDACRMVPIRHRRLGISYAAPGGKLRPDERARWRSAPTATTNHLKFCKKRKKNKKNKVKWRPSSGPMTRPASWTGIPKALWGSQLHHSEPRLPKRVKLAPGNVSANPTAF